MSPAPLTISTRQNFARPRTTTGVRMAGLQALPWTAVILAGLTITLPALAEETSPESPSQGSPKQSTEAFAAQIRPYFQKFCQECHSGDKAKAGVSLQFPENAEIAIDRGTWERVVGMLEARAMPPEDHSPRPTDAETAAVIDGIKSTFLEVDCTLADDPGRVTIRRLNRAEYNNTIRDLVGVDFQPARDFPSDDVGHGFDNIGDVLSISPLLFEKYLDVAEQISSKAIVADVSQPVTLRYPPDKLRTESGSRDGEDRVRLNSTGSAYVTVPVAATAEFIVRVEAAAEQAGPDPARMELRVDGQKVQVFDIEGHRKPDMYEAPVNLAAGERRIEAAFINDYYNPDEKNPRRRDRNLIVQSMEIVGTTPPVPEQLPETHRRIITCTPAGGRSVEECAREILIAFTSRAYRRPATIDDVTGFVQLAKSAVEGGETFERGIQLAVQAVLVSPHFLFRIEEDPEPDNPERKHEIGPYELASRLSYFLWSTMPDEELFARAAAGDLSRPDVLESQVRRMLADPKSRALVDNFASQWLNLRKFDEARPNRAVVSGFDEALQADMRRETELLFEHVMREDKSVLDLLNADYTFVNERLARHYGMEGVEGNEFRKVSLEGTPRKGVLTHASILTLTSDPTRTSPVKRGKWILENILGTPPPPPPANVPDLEVARKAKPDATLREQLAVHRANAMCATCHDKMDPLGLALENFDGVGRWRDAEDGKPIDASGTLPDGETFHGARELVAVLSRRDKEFAQHLTATLMTYALGRGLDDYDQCTVNEVADRLAADGYRFSTLVIGICQSDPFLMRRGEK